MLLVLPPKRNTNATVIGFCVDFVLCSLFFILNFVYIVHVLLTVVSICCTTILFIYTFLCILKYLYCKHSCQLDPCFAKNHVIMLVVILCFILYFYCAAAFCLLNYMLVILCPRIAAVLLDCMFCSLCAVVNGNEFARLKHISYISITYFTLLKSFIFDIAYYFVRRCLVSYLRIYSIFFIYCILLIYLGSRYVVCITFTNGS